MTAQQLKALEIASVVVIVIGLVVWYATPGNVVLPPLIIVLLGAAGAGVARQVRRGQAASSTNALANRVRAERERDENRPVD